MAHFHQLLLNVALTPDVVGGGQPLGGEAAGVVVGLEVGHAVSLVGVEHLKSKAHEKISTKKNLALRSNNCETNCC